MLQQIINLSWQQRKHWCRALQYCQNPPRIVAAGAVVAALIAAMNESSAGDAWADTDTVQSALHDFPLHDLVAAPWGLTTHH